MSDEPILPVEQVEEEPMQQESETPVLIEEPVLETEPDQPHDAVLLLAHGTPDVLGEMAEYLSKVTGGRALPQEVVEELQHRYAEIGAEGHARRRGSAADEVDADPGFLLEQALNYAGPNTKVYVGMRNWHPYNRGCGGADAGGRGEAVQGGVLAPQNSRTSVGLYRRRWRRRQKGWR